MEVTQKMYTLLYNTAADTLKDLDHIEHEIDEIEADIHKKLERYRADIHGIKARIKIAHLDCEKEYQRMKEPKGIPFQGAAKKPARGKKGEQEK